LLAPGGRGEDEIAQFAELLSLPNSAAALNLSPQRKREMQLEALLRPRSGSMKQLIETV
jgi:hypothetical protein